MRRHFSPYTIVAPKNLLYNAFGIRTQKREWNVVELKEGFAKAQCEAEGEGEVSKIITT